jgi:hypothetical protein
MSQRTTATERKTPTLPATGDDTVLAKAPASGRVGFDSRGNAVWEFRTEDQKFVREPSTTLVKKMPTPNISLEQTGVGRRTGSGSDLDPSQPIEGGDPFNRQGQMAAPSPAQQRKTTSRIVVTSRKQPGLIDRLMDWLNGRSR